jgi:hypothetical protein
MAQHRRHLLQGKSSAPGAGDEAQAFEIVIAEGTIRALSLAGRPHKAEGLVVPNPASRKAGSSRSFVDQHLNLVSC